MWIQPRRCEASSLFRSRASLGTPRFRCRRDWSGGLHGIVLSQPFFNHFLLRGQNHTLPFDGASAFTVLRHDIRTLIQHLDDALSLSPLKVIRRESGVMFLHLEYIIAGARNSGYFPVIRILSRYGFRAGHFGPTGKSTIE